MVKFSVLMSVYSKENSEFLDNAIESVLIKQTVKPDEVVLVEDGPLTKELELVINNYLNKFPSIIKIVRLETNKGLGEALNAGLEKCSYDLVARMDTDDISHPKRFEEQIRVFSEDNTLDLVGTNIAEFYDSPNTIVSIKEVPEDSKNIIKMSKRRNPINHMTVMFRKEAVLKAGGYKHMFYLEDYYLWVRMLNNNSKFTNIQKQLVYVRTGDSQFIRRSNPKYIKSWYLLQKEMHSYRMINFIDCVINMINITIFILIPARLKKFVYKKILRKST